MGKIEERKELLHKHYKKLAQELYDVKDPDLRFENTDVLLEVYKTLDNLFLVATFINLLIGIFVLINQFFWCKRR